MDVPFWAKKWMSPFGFEGGEGEKMDVPFCFCPLLFVPFWSPFGGWALQVYRYSLIILCT